jgi:hypothetical protein
MGFTKLDEGILRSSIMAEPAETFKAFIAILASTDPDGIARISSTFLAGACYLPIEIVDKAIETLEAPDPRSRTLGDEGRRIHRVDGGYLVINYQKYREFSPNEGNPDSPGAIRSRRWREKKQKNVTEPREVTGRDVTGVTSASASASGLQERRSGGEELEKLRAQADEIFDRYVAYAKKADIPWPRTKPPHKIQPGSAREIALYARIREGFSIEDVIEAIDAQPFLRGDNERGWLVNFDWLLKPANLTKILEGAFVKKRRGDAARRAPDDPKVGSADYGRKR